MFGIEDWVSVEIEVQVREGGHFQLQFFLQEVGDPNNRAAVEREALFTQNGLRRFRVSFYGLNEAHAYKVNLGIFDEAGNLRKWFDGLTMVYMKDGELAPPDLSTQAIEDPCYQGNR
ncbi:MAG: hypothetical protein M1343_11240 [Chloroflexi bacterium]|nr:hypothetical protein [Chloroflexota bacterium]